MADLVGFEFLAILGEGFRRWLVLPRLLADDLYGLPLREVGLRESCGGQPIWDMQMRINSQGRMFLDQGWPAFTDWYGLREGYILKFRYRGNNQFAVKIFDESMCCRCYIPIFPNEEGSGGSSIGGHYLPGIPR